MATMTTAATRLKDWLEQTKTSQSAVATKLGVKQASVSAWVNGHSRPEPHLRDALKALTAIQVSDWDLPEERLQRDAAMERIRDSKGAA